LVLDRIRRRTVVDPFPSTFDQPTKHGDKIRQMNPADELFAIPYLSAEKRLRQRLELGKCSASMGENNTNPNDGFGAGSGMIETRPFPLDAGRSQEALAGKRFLGANLV
jgi:hypothetical protein